MTYTKDFDQVGRGDVGMAGGKGANLGELARAGFPVPPGFVLTTAAYADFVEANGFGPRILELARFPPGAQGTDYDAAGQRIRALFDAGVMPEDIARELSEAYSVLSRQAAAPADGGLTDTPVAVRSSATAEDLASASFGASRTPT